MGDLIEAAGKLSEPITKLVEVIAQGVGGIYRPIGIRREAKAQADALTIKTAAEIDAMDLYARTVARMEYLGALRQKNIERIAEIAADEIPQVVAKEPVQTDWTLQFFDSAKDTTDEDMQLLWGRILAGEVASPGTYSRRTLQFLKTLERQEAEHFTQLCSLMFSARIDGGPGYLLAEKPTFDEIEKRIGPGPVLDHFSAIGLLAPAQATLRLSDLAEKSVFYFGEEYRCVGPQPRKSDSGYVHFENWLNYWSLTSIGIQLARIAGAEPVDGYVQRLSDGLDPALNVRFVKHTDSPEER